MFGKEGMLVLRESHLEGVHCTWSNKTSHCRLSSNSERQP